MMVSIDSLPDSTPTPGVGKPIGFWILPAALIGVVGGLHAVMLGMGGWNLWLYRHQSPRIPFSLSHILALMVIQAAGILFSVIAFRDWARRSPRRAIWTSLLAILLFAAAYAVHVAFLFTFV
jgi:hypothetical protein